MPRLIDADELIELLELLAKHEDPFRQSVILGVIDTIRSRQTIDPESMRPRGRWNYKHRHRGGFRQYTGLDSMGELHTITVDERFETDDPYCSECGKLNESVFLNFCPNCGAKMGEEK